MQNIVYIIDNGGIGPVLGYEAERFKKLEQSLKKGGYRECTIEELKRFKNIEVTTTTINSIKGKKIEMKEDVEHKEVFLDTDRGAEE